MNAERRLSEIAHAKADMKNAEAEFRRAAHGGAKAEFRAAGAEYDRAFKVRKKAIARCEFLGAVWPEGVK